MTIKRRCDKCGKISNNRTGEYVRKDGTCGYINTQEGDNTADGPICSDCRLEESPTQESSMTDTRERGMQELAKFLGEKIAKMDRISVFVNRLVDDVEEEIDPSGPYLRYSDVETLLKGLNE